jgi:hypothetical protein
MNSYMVDIDIPETLSSEFMGLIPHQRAFIKRMLREGTISNYSLSFDRKKLWVVVHADSLLDVKHIVGSFPIFSHIKFKINSLLFHENNYTSLPQLWLN